MTTQHTDTTIMGGVTQRVECQQQDNASSSRSADCARVLEVDGAIPSPTEPNREAREAFEQWFDATWWNDVGSTMTKQDAWIVYQQATASAEAKMLPVLKALVEKATQFIKDNGDLMIELADRIPDELDSDEGVDNLFDKAEKSIDELQNAIVLAAPLLSALAEKGE